MTLATSTTHEDFHIRFEAATATVAAITPKLRAALTDLGAARLGLELGEVTADDVAALEQVVERWQEAQALYRQERAACWTALHTTEATTANA